MGGTSGRDASPQQDRLSNSPNEANCWSLSVASATPTADLAGCRTRFDLWYQTVLQIHR